MSGTEKFEQSMKVMFGDALNLRKDVGPGGEFEYYPQFAQTCWEMWKASGGGSLEKIESASAGRHDWKLQGSAGIWESYYKCSKCEKPNRLAHDGPDFLPVEGCPGTATPAPAGIEHFGEVTVGDSFDGYIDDENCGSIHTAGINVGKWGNRIEIYGAGKNAAAEAEVLRDIVLSALGRVVK